MDEMRRPGKRGPKPKTKYTCNVCGQDVKECSICEHPPRPSGRMLCVKDASGKLIHICMSTHCMTALMRDFCIDVDVGKMEVIR